MDTRPANLHIWCEHTGRPEEKVSRYTGRPGTRGLTLDDVISIHRTRDTPRGETVLHSGPSVSLSRKSIELMLMYNYKSNYRHSSFKKNVTEHDLRNVGHIVDHFLKAVSRTISS
jgi:hypothetical protein